MSAQPIPGDYQEHAEVMECHHRETTEAWGRVSALARLAMASVRAREPLSAQAEQLIAADFALLDGALGVSKRNRWNG